MKMEIKVNDYLNLSLGKFISVLARKPEMHKILRRNEEKYELQASTFRLSYQ